MKSSVCQRTFHLSVTQRSAFLATSILLTLSVLVASAAAQNGGGSLKVTSFPSGAHVTIDGVDTGKTTPMSTSLTLGSHTVVLSVPGSGWTNATRIITVVSGDNHLNVTLLPESTTGGPPGPKGDKGDPGPQGPAGAGGNGGGLRGTQEFTTSGIFTVPDGVTNIFVELWGGGGGGQGGSSPPYPCTLVTEETESGTVYLSSCPPPGPGGAGGGSGAYVRSVIPVTPGETLYIVVAGGGAGSSGATSNALPSPGDYGGDTEIRQEGNAGPVLIAAAGGMGGNGGNYPTGTPGGSANSFAMISRAGRPGGIGGTSDSPGTGGATAVSGPLPGFAAGQGGKGGMGTQVGITDQGVHIFIPGLPGSPGLPGYALIVW